MFMKEKFETGKPTTVPFVSTVRGGVRYGINLSFGSTIWKINTRDASEGKLSELRIPVRAMVIV